MWDGDGCAEVDIFLADHKVPIEYNRAMHEDFQQRLQEAHAAFAERDWDRAVAALEALLPGVSSLPESGTPYSQLGQFLSSLGEYDQRWSLSPRLRVHIMLAQAYWHRGQQQAALELLEDLLQRKPTAELFQLLGRWLMERQQWEQAAQALGRALFHNLAYLPAYEDLLTLANLSGDSALVLKIARQALEQGLTPRIVEELLLACSEENNLPLRKIFIELCAYHISSRTRPMLVQLLQQLYADGDYLNAEYLGFHLLDSHVVEPPVLNVYVLAALHQGHYAQALRALLEAPSSHQKEGSYWLKLGVVYTQWRMPGLARRAYERALKQSSEQSSELRRQCEAALESLPPMPEAEDLLGEILRQQAVSPRFRAALREDAGQALKPWQIELPPELLEKIPSSASAP